MCCCGRPVAWASLASSGVGSSWSLMILLLILSFICPSQMSQWSPRPPNGLYFLISRFPKLISSDREPWLHWAALVWTSAQCRHCWITWRSEGMVQVHSSNWRMGGLCTGDFSHSRFNKHYPWLGWMVHSLTAIASELELPPQLVGQGFQRPLSSIWADGAAPPTNPIFRHRPQNWPKYLVSWPPLTLRLEGVSQPPLYCVYVTVLIAIWFVPHLDTLSYDSSSLFFRLGSFMYHRVLFEFYLSLHGFQDGRPP